MHHKYLGKIDLCTCCPWAYQQIRPRLLSSELVLSCLGSSEIDLALFLLCCWRKPTPLKYAGASARGEEWQLSDVQMSYSPPLLHLPMLRVSVNFSASNGLFIDIPILQLTLYGKRQTLPGAYKRQ